MVRTAKVTLTLPKPILTWLQETAEEHYVSTEEHIRALIVGLYVHEQRLKNFPRDPDLTSNPSSDDRHKQARSFTSRSGYKGVYPYGKKWAAVVYVNGRQERVAVCDTAEEAARAYDQAMVERSGNPRMAANAHRANERSAAAVNAPYFAKLARGEQLSDVEYAAWKRAASTATDDETSMPVPLITSRPEGSPVAPLATVRRPVRRGSAPAIERPSEPEADPET